MRDATATAYFAPRDGWVGAGIWFTSITLYKSLQARRNEVEEKLHGIDGTVEWRSPSSASRELLIELKADLASEHWDALYEWLVAAMLRLHVVADMLRTTSNDNSGGAGTNGDTGTYQKDDSAVSNHEQQLCETDFDEPAVLIKITGVDPSSMSESELYDRIRCCWKVSPNRVRAIHLALGVCNGRVVEVYRVDKWLNAEEAKEQGDGLLPEDGRYLFVGKIASDEIRNRYKGRFASELSHGQNPIRYVGDV